MRKLNAMGKILIIEDDQQLRDMLVYFLADIEGYNVLTLSTGEGALNTILETRPSLVLLDVQLPNENGLNILSDLRSKGEMLPVIVMTANDNELTETNALSLGANDYITKPIRTAALRERIKRQLSASSLEDGYTQSTTVVLAPLEQEVTMYLKKQCLVHKNIEMKLLPSDIEVLMSLTKNDFPKPIRDIFYDIHGFECPVDDRSVYMRISSLRKRLSNQWPDLELIKNHRAKGFFLSHRILVK
ncbi:MULTISPECIES: response regulator transcription factor [unclassified Vibrio]|uniref:response regulator transcription factor n=1 Tax=unclassified Vibrio TaxID=2614977 RepID=UPI001F5393A9|nr:MULTISPECIES: response regulator transcription factor [unclassified Vibrio]